jgi:hypothetical protein
MSLKRLHAIAGHPERSLPRDRGSRGQVFVRGVAGRQTESKDLHFGMFACVDEFLKHHARS